MTRQGGQGPKFVILVFILAVGLVVPIVGMPLNAGNVVAQTDGQAVDGDAEVGPESTEIESEDSEAGFEKRSVKSAA